jgi:hypothetical protein
MAKSGRTGYRAGPFFMHSQPSGGSLVVQDGHEEAVMTITTRGGPGDGRLPSAEPGHTSESPLLRALVARFLDPDTSRAHVGPPAPLSPPAPLR